MPQPTQELHDTIQALHAAIASEPEPGDKAELSKALVIIMRVQAKNMTQDAQNGGPPGGQGPPVDQGPPPDLGGPPVGIDPRAALAAQLQGGGFQ